MDEPTITEPELDMLRTIASLPFAPKKVQLVELTRLSRPTVHDRVERLVDLGMVDCAPYSRGVRITDKGRRYAERQKVA